MTLRYRFKIVHCPGNKHLAPDDLATPVEPSRLIVACTVRHNPLIYYANGGRFRKIPMIPCRHVDPHIIQDFYQFRNDLYTRGNLQRASGCPTVITKGGTRDTALSTSRHPNDDSKSDVVSVLARNHQPDKGNAREM